MSDNNAEAVLRMEEFDREFERALRYALTRSTLNVIKATNGCTLLYNIDLSVTPSSTELGLMYKRRHGRFLSICPLAFQYQKGNDTDTEGKVPVTPAYTAVECQTFHTITIRHTDVATVVVLIRESDNYVVGIRVYRNEDESHIAPWLTFRGVQLPRRFRNVVEMDYDYAYETIVDINFGKNTLADIVEFLVSLRTNPKQNAAENGKLLFRSLFLLFGEAQRFRVVRNWILRTSQCGTPENIPMNIANIFRKWSDFSKICFEYRLGIYEHTKFSNSSIYKDAMLSVITAENAHAHTVLKFRDSQKKFCLVGGEVLLLKHDFDWCTRILMRLNGYEGDLNLKNYNIRRRHGRNFVY